MTNDSGKYMHPPTESALVQTFSRGSEWRKWDLHVHTPGTAHEDNYTSWEDFLKALRAETEVSVMGVTDYLSIDNYEQLIKLKGEDKLGSIDLLIPNIEFRVTPQTDRGHAVNLHLLIDPGDPAHCQEIHQALARLSIEYERQPFSCTKAGITKLGAAYSPGLANDEAHYREGANQFKVDFSVFCDWYEKEIWLNKHSLVAVAGGNDGPSGIKDSGWAAKQEEIWRFAHIVFSGNPNNRSFWLAEDIDNSNGALKLGAPKPCLNGCDAHSLDDLFKPRQSRFCWIKADPTFEGLRQTLYEPKERVWIGQHPPSRHDKSRVISELSISGGSTPLAFKNATISLNSGLVTIIGQKGSGKSALTDLLAYACGVNVGSDRLSFISRAQEYLSGTTINLTWLDGHTSSATIGDKVERMQAIRYLSQSFVERLCSDDYAGIELTNEIERVIFSNLDPTDTLNTSSFKELRGVKTQELSAERVKLTSKIRELIAEDESLRETIKSVPAKKNKVSDLGEELRALKNQIPAAETVEEAEAQKELTVLRQELQKLQGTVAGLKQRLLKLQQLRSKLDQFKSDFETSRLDFVAQAKALGLEAPFDLELHINGEKALDDLASDLIKMISHAEGKDGGSIEGEQRTIKKLGEVISDVEKRVASDQARRTQIQQIQKRIANVLQEISRLQTEIVGIESSNVDRSKTIRQARLDAYEDLFKSWKKEQAVLEDLYEPVRGKLLKGLKEEKMLDFYIRWDIDIEDWLERGNQLFDQRKAHPFGSALKFREAVRSSLVPGWTTGEPTKIKEGMNKLLDLFKEKSIESYLRARTTHSDLLGWVFGYDHIKLNYGLRYNGTELDKLSPGTKGIVLLILYLAMDSEDWRPLVVDQPEENLDSESIYSLLSRYFRSAKELRQVIVITHNPNLVVNTDSDQVIVASSDRLGGSFPTFSYASGGLENAAGIREKVCLILEGGESAFLKRERRYALRG